VKREVQTSVLSWKIICNLKSFEVIVFQVCLTEKEKGMEVGWWKNIGLVNLLKRDMR